MTVLWHPLPFIAVRAKKRIKSVMQYCAYLITVALLGEKLDFLRGNIPTIITKGSPT
jgi:hypothetical protein